MTLRASNQALYNVWSYDFYDMTLATDNGDVICYTCLHYNTEFHLTPFQKYMFIIQKTIWYMSTQYTDNIFT